MGPSSDVFYSTLETHEEGEEEEEPEPNADVEATEGTKGREGVSLDVGQNNTSYDANEAEPLTAPPRLEEHRYRLMRDDNLNSPLLHPGPRSYYPGMDMEEPVHMNRLYKACAIIYYVSLVLIVGFVGVSIYYFPKIPVYNVCNDSLAWRKIIENIAALKLDASFEILISFSNPNHLSAVLDKGGGTFKFEGQHIGTFEIPPVTAAAVAITDLMLVAHVTPNKLQALQIAEAYYKNKLVLDADFNGKVRVPALDNFVYNIKVDSITVNVSEVMDRSLCACPTWDDSRNHTSAMLLLN